jgi:hypothetical protein
MGGSRDLADTADKLVASRGNLEQCDIAEQESKLPRTLLLRLFHWPDTCPYSKL